MRNKITAVILLVTVMLSLSAIQVFGAAKNQAPGGIVTDYDSLAAALGGEYCVVTKDDRIVIVKDIVLKAPIVITEGSYLIVGEGASITAGFEKGDFFVLDGEGVVLTLGDPKAVNTDSSDRNNVGDRDVVFDGEGKQREGSFVLVSEGSKLQMYASIEMSDALTAVSGGAIYNYGELEMYGGSIKNCQAIASGGAVFNAGEASLVSGSIEGCSANHGGAVYNEGSIHLLGTAIKNSFAVNGGGIFNSGSLSFKASEITGCKGDKGGAVYNSGSAEIEGGSISLNLAENGLGGGIYNSSNLDITSGAVKENKARNGGNVYNTDTVKLAEGSALFGGEATECGGNLYNGGEGLLNFEKGSVSGGKAIYGGGIYNEGTLHHSGGGIFKNRAELGEGVLNHGVYLLDGTAYVEKDDDIFVVKDENNSHLLKVAKGWSNSLGVINISAGIYEENRYVSDIQVGDKLISVEAACDASESFALFGSPKKLVLNSNGEVAKAPVVKLEVVLTVLGIAAAFALTVTALVFGIRYFDKKKAVG